MKLLIVALYVVVVLAAMTGCSTLKLQSPVTSVQTITNVRDATKTVVDLLCPAPTVPDPRGSFEAGFFDRYMKNRTATELSPQDIADIKAFKAVCNKTLAERSDYDYGTLAGGALDRITIMLLPSMGKDFFSVMSALGILIK